MASGSERRFHARAFLFAVPAAPASAFVIWTAVTIMTGGVGLASLTTQTLGALLLLALVVVWGALPAAGFGALVLVPLERLFRGGAPVAALIPAGLFAAGLYSVSAILLGLGEQQWAFLMAPWVVGLLEEEPGRFHALGPMVTAIVLSGGVAALVYARVAGRITSPRSSSEAPRAER